MRRGNGQTGGERVRVDRPLACFALAALAMVGAIAVDATVLYVGVGLVFPGFIAALLARRRAWAYSYASNAIAAVTGSALAAAAVAAATNPTELDSDPIVYTVMIFIFVGFAGAIAAAIIGPFAWVVWRWLGGR